MTKTTRQATETRIAMLRNQAAREPNQAARAELLLTAGALEDRLTWDRHAEMAWRKRNIGFTPTPG